MNWRPAPPAAGTAATALTEVVRAIAADVIATQSSLDEHALEVATVNPFLVKSVVIDVGIRLRDDAEHMQLVVLTRGSGSSKLRAVIAFVARAGDPWTPPSGPGPVRPHPHD